MSSSLSKTSHMPQMSAPRHIVSETRFQDLASMQAITFRQCHLILSVARAYWMVTQDPYNLIGLLNPF